MNDWSYKCEVWYFTYTDVFLSNKFFPEWLCLRWWCIFSNIKYYAWFQDPKVNDVCVASTSQDCMSTVLLLSVGSERCDCCVISSGIMFIPRFMKVGRLMQMFKLKAHTDGMVICLLSSVRKEDICTTKSENSLIAVLSVANAVITLLLKHWLEGCLYSYVVYKEGKSVCLLQVWRSGWSNMNCEVVNQI